MHELSLCRSIIKSVEQYLEDQKDVDITSINIAIGVFSCVDESALKFNFMVLCKNTRFDSVKLQCEEVSALAECQDCKNQYQPDSLFSECRTCQSLNTKLIRGNELKITSIEVK